MIKNGRIHLSWKQRIVFALIILMLSMILTDCKPAGEEGYPSLVLYYLYDEGDYPELVFIERGGEIMYNAFVPPSETYVVLNAGTEDLTVDSVSIYSTSGSPELVNDPTPFSLAPGELVNIILEYGEADAGYVTFISNDTGGDYVSHWMVDPQIM